jgi:acyl-homoserine-lactone acylase
MHRKLEVRRTAAWAGLVLGTALLASCGGGDSGPSFGPLGPQYAAEIRRTSFGIPHIVAADEAGMAYGVGYAYSQDNFCVLADEILTVNGERSKWLGADAANIYGRNNLRSDFYFKLINDQAALDDFLARQTTEARALIRGYVAGVNRYLRETGAANVAGDCKGAGWIRPITESDMARLVRRLSVEASGIQFMDAMYAAQPPAISTSALRPGAYQRELARQVRTVLASSEGPFSKKHWDELREQTGSNAVALGADATSNGVGLLLGNPHFPWFGVLRFYQLHVTIPGKMDVMGGALTGFPGVNIGFNRNIAWSHTVNTSAHFTLFALQLDPADPTRYIYDGVSRPMDRKILSVEVKNADGSLSTQTRTYYSTLQGPIVVRPGGLEWTRTAAFALRDANLDNWRLLEQWYRMNRASSLAELRTALETVVGIPWVNTVAVDRGGNAYYANISVVPNVPLAKQSACITGPLLALLQTGLVVLPGQTSACAWTVDPGTAQPGIFAASALPQLSRRDYVQNSNDSSWFTNPAQPLTGFPAVVSVSGTPLNGRTRIGIEQIQARLAGTDGRPGNRFDQAILQQVTLSNRVYWAEAALPGLITNACSVSSHTVDGQTVDFTAPCATLNAWDRKAELASVGVPLFMAWWDRVASVSNLWVVPFNPADPVNTPRQVRTDSAAVTTAVRDGLARAVLQLQRDAIPYTRPWGDVQLAAKAIPVIPIHGADGTYGVYNAIRSGLVAAAPGARVVNFGSSYLQTVTWDGDTPRTDAFLTYSQSTDAASPNYADQTRRFSAKQWITVPYTDAQIVTDPGFRRVSIAE